MFKVNIIEEDTIPIVSKIDFSQLENKNILITGATGIVGIYMLACLAQVQSKYKFKIHIWNKSDIPPYLRNCFKFDYVKIKFDLTKEASFQYLMNFDYIIHAAGYGQPAKFLDDKVKTIKLNTLSTIELLKKLNPQGKFLFVSTSELYNGLEKEFVTESDIGKTSPDNPRACYIEGKRTGEAICHIYREKGYDVKIARLSLGYGPGTKVGDGRVLNSFIEKGIKNNEINLMDSGQAMRTYCYMADVAEMFWNILLFGKEHTYNVGGKSEITIADLAKTIGNKMDKRVVFPEVEQSMKGAPGIVRIPIDKYVKEFNKKDFVSLDYGLDRTIAWISYIHSYRGM